MQPSFINDNAIFAPMSEIFETYMKTFTSLTKEEVQRIRSLAITRKIRKRQLLLQEGDICRHKVFITKGLFRTYRVKDDGTEYIMRFIPENSWAVDHESYHRRTPTQYNIEALEDSEVMLWTKEDFDQLFDEIPQLRIFSDELKSNNFDASQRRILMHISYTSEEKYQAFVDAFPDIFRRVPLHMVASYLGVSRETLSRIRHAQMRQQK